MKERKERDGGGVAQGRGQGDAIPGGRGLRRLGMMMDVAVEARRESGETIMPMEYLPGQRSAAQLRHSRILPVPYTN